MRMGQYSVYDALKREYDNLDLDLHSMSTTDNLYEIQDIFGLCVNRVVTLRNLHMQRIFGNKLNPVQEGCPDED